MAIGKVVWVVQVVTGPERGWRREHGTAVPGTLRRDRFVDLTADVVALWAAKDLAPGSGGAASCGRSEARSSGVVTLLKLRHEALGIWRGTVVRRCAPDTARAAGVRGPDPKCAAAQLRTDLQPTARCPAILLMWREPDAVRGPAGTAEGRVGHDDIAELCETTVLAGAAHVRIVAPGPSSVTACCRRRRSPPSIRHLMAVSPTSDVAVRNSRG